MNMKRAVLSFCFLLCAMASTGQCWQYVDPRIGSVGVGRTFPGPCMPFGMVKPGRDCGVLPNAGWALMPAEVTGFSQTHVSGTGGGQKYGNILIQPVLADVQEGKGMSQRRTDETIALGYYATTYENGIRTEITTSERCAHYRIHYPRRSALFIDATHFLGKDSVPDLRERQQFVGAEVEVVSDREVRGYSRIRGGWNNGDAYTVYFALLTDVLFTTNAAGDDGTVLLHFADTLLHVKVGISYVSSLQARKNIDSIGFDQQLSRLRDAWEQQLSKVKVEGSDTEKRMFYTALYHTMLMPVDKTGENPKWTDAPYYDDYYAIWDTYRTSSPLITLLDPHREAAIINSLLNIYRREGYMPDARSGDCNGRTQGGSNAEVMIADAYAKHIDGIDYSLALEAMLKDGEADPGADHEKHGRGGLSAYHALGYIPYGIDRAGNRTVEYAFNDYCIAQVAKGLGKTHLSEVYQKRSANWKNLWRCDYEYDGMRGFIMPRDADGQWLDSVPWGLRPSNFTLHSSLFSLHSSLFKIPYTPTTKVAPWYVPWWSTFFYEATSEEYSLSIPHDVEGLIEACGGAAAFRRRLDLFFLKGYYNVQNEPSFLTPGLYHWIGRPDLSNERIHQIIRDNYTDAPDGLPGNDDSGAMSSWLAFHMMGLYPNAGMSYYLLNVPLFREYTFTLSNGRQLHVVRRGEDYGLKRILFNGRELSDARIEHDDLMNGGELLFETRPMSPMGLMGLMGLMGPMGPMGPMGLMSPMGPMGLIGPMGAIEPAHTIHFTLNRQFRSWPLGFQWQGDSLLVRCKETHYYISRAEVERSSRFCWQSPQVDGTVHHDAKGTFCFVSRAALQRLHEQKSLNYDGFCWRLLDVSDGLLHVKADDYDAEMWIADDPTLPLIMEMRHNPLGIDWKITPYEKK